MERKIKILIFLLFLISGCGGSSSASKKEGRVISGDFSPTNPTSSDVITLKITTLTLKSPEFRWTVNGGLVPVNKNQLEPKYFSKGDTVWCSILIEGVEKKKIGPIVIRNSPPRINSVEISPPGPRAGRELSVKGEAVDVDGDEVELIPRWFINGKEVGEKKILSGSEIKAGDEVYAVVTPFDGEEKGFSVNTNLVVVQNTPPEFVSFSSSTEDKILRYEIQVKDIDGDKVELVLLEAPLGVRLDGSTLILDAPERDTSFLVKIKAKDERGGETTNTINLNIKKREEK
ncbi:MAG: hypothetical protein ABIN61_00620 [candidate division WOR-3 bacterium]